MKIIFLDIDGVLIPVSGNGNKGFNGRNVDNLNELVRKTGAKIVITSDWKRKQPFDFVKDVLYESGVQGEIIDMTPNLAIENNNNIKVPRGTEIQTWINSYNSFNEETGDLKYVLNYVILDDHMDMLIEQLDHFVEINQSKGFDGKALKDAIEILTKNNIII